MSLGNQQFNQSDKSGRYLDPETRNSLITVAGAIGILAIIAACNSNTPPNGFANRPTSAIHTPAFGHCALQVSQSENTSSTNEIVIKLDANVGVASAGSSFTIYSGSNSERMIPVYSGGGLVSDQQRTIAIDDPTSHKFISAEVVNDDNNQFQPPITAKCRT
jgi:hypothetical protein